MRPPLLLSNQRRGAAEEPSEVGMGADATSKSLSKQRKGDLCYEEMPSIRGVSFVWHESLPEGGMHIQS